MKKIGWWLHKTCESQKSKVLSFNLQDVFVSVTILPKKKKHGTTISQQMDIQNHSLRLSKSLHSWNFGFWHMRLGWSQLLEIAWEKTKKLDWETDRGFEIRIVGFLLVAFF